MCAVSFVFLPLNVFMHYKDKHNNYINKLFCTFFQKNFYTYLYNNIISRASVGPLAWHPGRLEAGGVATAAGLTVGRRGAGCRASTG